MRDPLLLDLVTSTLREVRCRLGVDAYLEDLVLQVFHPWMAAFVEYGDGSRGCGFCSSVYRGMFGGLRRDLLYKGLSMVRRGSDAYRVVEDLAYRECRGLEEQVLVNAITISTLNALSYRLLSREELEADGFHVEEHMVGDYLLGHRIGMVLRRIVEPSDRVAVVGYAYWAFPYVVDRVRELRCLELLDEELFEVATLSGLRPRVKVFNDPGEALGDADVVFITGMTIPNETLPEILKHSSSARLRALYGPSCSFHPARLFKLGVDLLLAMKVPIGDEVKQSIVDSRGLSAYEDPRTRLVEVWRDQPPS